MVKGTSAMVMGWPQDVLLVAKREIRWFSHNMGVGFLCAEASRQDEEPRRSSRNNKWFIEGIWMNCQEAAPSWSRVSQPGNAALHVSHAAVRVHTWSSSPSSSAEASFKFLFFCSSLSQFALISTAMARGQGRAQHCKEGGKLEKGKQNETIRKISKGSE